MKETANKLAVFGGTFNPIHNGHLHMAREFAARLQISRVLLIPTYTPPHKAAPDLIPAEHRLAMCCLAVAGDPLFEVSDLEIRRQGPSYTSDTLRQIKDQNPETELFLLMGEDMFLTVENWHEPHQIYALATLCAAPRGSENNAKMEQYARMIAQYGAKSRIENIEFLPISSTMVREAVKHGGPIDHLVPEPVADYVKRHRLYLG